MGTIYALLVGIDAYRSVTPLSGCVSDVKAVAAWLEQNVPAGQLAMKALFDADATRDAVIEGFRSHMGRAGAGDVAFFHYAGHGSRYSAPPEFLPIAPDGRDEGLVCFDSRDPGKWELADKELAILIDEVAKTCGHIVISLDCCHSGSGTRDGEPAGVAARMAPPASGVRPLGDYLGGHYQAMLETTGRIVVPAPKHMLLAAADRSQTAKETDGHGIFTTTLLAVLNANHGAVSYAELFSRTRAATRARIASLRLSDQDPQFEAMGGFDAGTGFLGLTPPATPTATASFRDGAWRINLGALSGLPLDPTAPARFALVADAGASDDAGPPATTARAVTVGPDESVVVLDPDPPATPAAQARTYRARLTSLPAPPLALGFEGSAALKAQFETRLKAAGATPVALLDAAPMTERRLVERNGEVQLVERGSELVLQRVVPDADGRWIDLLLPVFDRIGRFDRLWELYNPQTQLPQGLVTWAFEDLDPNGKWYPAKEPGYAKLKYRQVGNDWYRIPVRLTVTNGTAARLHFCFLYFGSNYQIMTIKNDQAGAGASLQLLGDKPTDNFFLDEGQTRVTERFKLVASTDRIDDFLLNQDGLAIGGLLAPDRGFGGATAAPKPVISDWCTRNLTVEINRG